MPQTLAISLAEKILQGFKTYMSFFDTYTKLVPTYFQERNWIEIQLIHQKRLRLYKDLLVPLSEECKEILKHHATEPSSWVYVKNHYSKLIVGMYNVELAETFFNSVVRKILPKKVVNEDFMFVVEGFDSIEITENSELIQHIWELKESFDKF
jgi:isocitrate dehydrogenase kinase/phosphatase